MRRNVLLGGSSVSLLEDSVSAVISWSSRAEEKDLIISCIVYFSCLVWPKQSPSAGVVVRHCGGPRGRDCLQGKE